MTHPSTDRQVSVCQSETHVWNGKQNRIAQTNCSDTRSLREYLDELTGRYKRISEDGLPVP